MTAAKGVTPSMVRSFRKDDLEDAGFLLALLHVREEHLAEGCRRLRETCSQLKATAAGSPWVTHLRCARCGLLILGRRGVAMRAAAHERVCPGGDRSSEVWFPFVPDVPAWRLRPVLRLIRGGAPNRSWLRGLVE